MSSDNAKVLQISEPLEYLSFHSASKGFDFSVHCLSVAIPQSVMEREINSDILYARAMVFQGTVGKYVQPEIMSRV